MSAPDDQSDHDKTWFNSRNYDRGAVEIYADIREHGGGKNKVQIIDLSQSGFRFRSVTHIRDDRSIFLTIPHFTALEARIAWNDRGMYGARFIYGLHEAIYEHILKTYPSLEHPR
jgi:hypothetical protein